VTSAAYRQTSVPDAKNVEGDPENSLFGRCGKVHHNCADSPARRYRMECGKGAV